MAWKDELVSPTTIIAIGLAVITTLIGAGIAFYFYQKSEKAGRLSLAVDQVQVFDKARLGQAPLRVLDASGNVITDNVFAASVALWNSGNAEIQKTDVRRPFRIKIGD